MSVEPSQAITDLWSRWQGHAINTRFVLGHSLGCSDHSGVFLTQSVAHPALRLAAKLVPTTRAIAQARLPVCKQVRTLAHPHLLGLYESGVCQLDGSPHLYVVMECADQTLAQVLQYRAMNDGEAREMLVPILEALTFLHGQNLVQGQLKPSNILVVGHQLKLATDTIRRVGKITVGTSPLSQYDPPEARHGSATAGDVWALGVSLSEALARRAATASVNNRKAVELPSDFSPAFREIVSRCLSTAPQDRPSVAEITAWAVEREVAAASAAINTPTALVPETGKAEPASPANESEPNSAVVAPLPTPQVKPRVLMVAAFATVILALGWTAVRGFIGHRPPARIVTVPVVEQMPVPSVAPAPAVAPVALHEVIPDVPQSVQKSIRVPVNIGVRVMVEQDGSVFAALEDRSNASKRLQRLAIDAAKEWIFPPADTPGRRLMQIRFDFSSEGTTASAHSLD
jgi:protein kinase-like protein